MSRLCNTSNVNARMLGVKGQQGDAGNTILSGTIPPTADDGVEGDFWLDLTTSDLYGPKGATDWILPPISLKGSQGDAGVDGVDGVDGDPGVGIPAGGSAESVLKKASNIDYDTYWSTISSQITSWIVVSTNHDSINNSNIIGDTTDSAFSISLPSTPSIGWQVRIKSTISHNNNLTILRNGSPIMSDDEDYIINGDFIDITFVYVNSTIGWII